MKLMIAGAGGLQIRQRDPLPMKIQMTPPSGLRGLKGDRGDDGWAAPVQSVIAPGGPLMLDYSAGKTVDLTIEGDTSLDFAGFPVAGFLARFTLQIWNPGNHLISFPEGIKWTGAPPPIFSGISMLAFTTIDGGVTTLGHVIGADYQEA